jgi:hypothetical protein
LVTLVKPFAIFAIANFIDHHPIFHEKQLGMSQLQSKQSA